jgi:hypothetical protein
MGNIYSTSAPLESASIYNDDRNESTVIYTDTGLIAPITSPRTPVINSEENKVNMPNESMLVNTEIKPEESKTNIAKLEEHVASIPDIRSSLFIKTNPIIYVINIKTSTSNEIYYTSTITEAHIVVRQYIDKIKIVPVLYGYNIIENNKEFQGLQTSYLTDVYVKTYFILPILGYSTRIARITIRPTQKITKYSS